VPIVLDPIAAYDRIAPVFAHITAERRAYLDGVDRLVISEMPAQSRSLQDVGSGDGRRARRISQARGIAQLVLVEPAVAMQAAMQGANGAGAGFLTLRAEELSTLAGEFDAITGLWNVLGHIFPAASRTQVLREFARLVSPQGRIFVDVQHRYNARHYGVLPTAGRFLKDRLRWSEDNGDVSVDWDVEGVLCTTRGHVFTHREFRSLAQAAGLKICKRLVVDYATGVGRRWSFAGHLLYVLERTALARVQQTS